MIVMGSTAFPAVPFATTGPQAPLATLCNCHRRVLAYCATLRRLVLYVCECGCTRDAQVVSHGVLRFFDIEVPRHYADEEEDLFPALIESMAGSDAVCRTTSREALPVSIERSQASGASCEGRWRTLRRVATCCFLPRPWRLSPAAGGTTSGSKRASCSPWPRAC